MEFVLQQARREAERKLIEAEGVSMPILMGSSFLGGEIEFVPRLPKNPSFEFLNSPEPSLIGLEERLSWAFWNTF